jgi:hypothetical protein
MAKVTVTVVPPAEVERVSHPRLAADEIARRGKELYEQRLRPQVETDENIGKIIAVDVETGDYAIDADLLKAAHRVLDRHAEAALWMERIGYDAVYAFGSSLTRTAG